MLQIQNLTITHKKDLRPLLTNFTFSLQNGDRAVIIGEEGNGKSTLLKLLHSEDLVEDYASWEGRIQKGNTRTGYLAQELLGEKTKQSVYEYCAKSPVFFETSPREMAAIAARLGLSFDFFYSDQMVETLSGGEKVKLQMALILMEQPDLLLLDEPSNDIDIATLQWLERFIGESKVPVIFISHDELLIERTANVIIHLEQTMRKTVPRCTVARMGYQQYVKERETMLERTAQIAADEKREYEKQQERFRKIQQKVEHQQNAVSRQDPHGGRLLKKKMKSVKSQERRFEREWQERTKVPDTEDAMFIRFDENIRIPNGKTILEYELKELTVGDRCLAKGLLLRVTGPAKVCIIGKNGAGKSTFLKKIASELLSRTDIRAAYMPQNYEELLPLDQTPAEFLSCTGDKEELTRIRTYLGSMKYTFEEMDHAIHELSGGQKAKLLFLKMSMDGSDVLILDEPTRNFSPLSNPVIRKVLQNFGGTIISISHDRKYISEVCDTVYELKEDGLYPVTEPEEYQ